MAPSMSSLLASLLALVFGWAAIAKVVRFDAWRGALAGYGLPGPVERAARFSTPVLEGAVAGLILAGAVVVGAALALALAAAFSLAVLRARTRSGKRLPCGCVGGRKARDYRGLLAMDLALGLAAGAVLVTGEAAAPARLEPSAAAPVLLAVVGVALAGWVVRQVAEGMRGG